MRFGKHQLRIVSGDDGGSGYPKAALWLRAGARLTDCAIAWALWIASGPAGVVLALLYLLFADGMIQGQSPGKKLFGVRVVYLPTRQPARHRDSVLRNGPIGLVIILRMMPELGLKAFIAGTLVIGGIEAVRALRDKEGLRLGDLWAQTQVTDAKIALTQSELAQARGEEARAGARLKEQTQLPRSHESGLAGPPTNS
jgi:uncharacterized RDD family membrane protein YckC